MKGLKILIIIVLGFSIGNCFSQDITREKEVFKSQWINAGIGGTNELSSLSLGINNNYKNNKFLSLRLLYSEASINYFNINKISQFKDWGLLHGWVYKKDILFVSASAGISLVSISKRIENNIKQLPNYTEKIYYQAAIPLEFKIMLVPLKFLSIGGSINGNLNVLKGYHTFMVEIGVGNFR